MYPVHRSYKEETLVERNYDLEKRKYAIGGAVIFIVLIFLIRLLSLQIMSEDYKKNADSNAFLEKDTISKPGSHLRPQRKVTGL